MPEFIQRKQHLLFREGLFVWNDSMSSPGIRRFRPQNAPPVPDPRTFRGSGTQLPEAGKGEAQNNGDVRRSFQAPERDRRWNNGSRP